MENGTEAKAAGAPREPVKHRMGRRCNGWDYARRAIYMITVKLAERGKPVLAGWPVESSGAGNSGAGNSGARAGAQNSGAQNSGAQDAGAQDAGAQNSGAQDAGAQKAGAENAEAPDCEFRASPRAAKFVCPPTPLGETVLACWREIPSRWPAVSLIGDAVMPDHFHGILFVERPLPPGKTLGNVIGSFKSRSTSLCLAALGRTRPGAEPPGRGSCASPRAAKFWEEGFTDTILFREGQLAGMVEYLRANPERLAEKRANPELFHRVARLAIPLEGGRTTGLFEALGNRHLLRRPLHQVQCSRRFFAWKREPKPGGGLKIVRDAAGEPVAERASPDDG